VSTGCARLVTRSSLLLEHPNATSVATDASAAILVVT
jgi:hypothetical protein